MDKRKNVLVIGCGNMPQALLASHPHFHFMTYTPSQKRAIVLAKKLNGEHISSLNQLDWDRVDIVLLGCKPQQLRGVASEISSKFSSRMLVISMLAGVNLETQIDLLGHKNIIRIMPNITSQVGKGSLLVYPELTRLNKANFDFLEIQAKIYPVKTEQIFDQLMLITGSGPAYIFYLVRSLERHLDKIGLNSQLYKSAIEDTFSGAVDIMQASSKLTTSDLIAKVASKGGVTQEAIAFFDENNFDDIVDGAMKAGVRRSQELQKTLEI